MVSVERLEPFEDYHFPHFRNGVGRSFPSRLYSAFDSVFDEDKDMELGSTLLDSMFHPLHHRSRHGKYTLASPFSSFERTDVHDSAQPSSDVTVIPIKVEHRPDRSHEQRNVKFRLLNGSPNQTEVKNVLPELIDFASSPHSPASEFPKDHQRFLRKDSSNVEKLTDSLNSLALGSNGSVCVDGFTHFDSKDMLPKTYTGYDSHEKKTDVWKSIPVQHVVSSRDPKSNTKSNLNNNSSGTKDFPVAKKAVSQANDDDERDFPNTASTRDTSNTSLPSTNNDNSESEFEEREVNTPPSYPIYDVLKVKLAQENRKIDYIRGDGNCFFRALSKELYGSEKYHKALRNVIVDIIATNSSKFAQFVDEEDVQEHVRRMGENHCWATTCEIYAAATLLERDIFMLTPDHLNKNYSWLLFKPVFKVEEGHSDTTSHYCYITFCNTNGNHYDRIVSNHGGCNCFLPRPQLGTVGAS